jgi:hypothetical protein
VHVETMILSWRCMARMARKAGRLITTDIEHPPTVEELIRR